MCLVDLVVCAVLFLVVLIIGMRVITQIGQGIVGVVTIVVADLHSIRTRPYECLRNKPMNPQASSRVHESDLHTIFVGVSLQNATLTDAGTHLSLVTDVISTFVTRDATPFCHALSVTLSDLVCNRYTVT